MLFLTMFYLEAHDLVCKVAEIVVVGGVGRWALVQVLSDVVLLCLGCFLLALLLWRAAFVSYVC
jgi:hypothetical protein